MLVQLSGVPGSGKSTLARSVAGATGIVVLDTDVLKSSIVGSGVPVAAAGPVTYAAVLALAQDLLEQGRSVLLDSPCRYQELLDSGRQMANVHGVRYAFIELWVHDWGTVLHRLDGRSPRPSQLESATSPVPGTDWEFATAEETLATWQTQLLRPEHDWLRLDAEDAAKDNLRAALRYLGPHR
ncbi:AAA family ATPase [Nocardioides astragali]|uniref:AAA family ATPase n=1 Tax=Nocardioides astragali TaxID=1776736 RepID=A0ABW2N8T0_9ACTN